MTVLNICSIPEFTKDYKNVADFKNETNRTNWFLPRVKIFLESNVKMDNFTTSIVINRQMDNILRSCDYLFADTSDGSKKLFFFIDNMEQLSQSTSKLYLTLDVWQTYLFDLQLKPSYVARQHVPRWNSDGTPTREVVPEPVSVNNYIVGGTAQNKYKINQGCYIYYTSAPVGLITKDK